MTTFVDPASALFLLAENRTMPLHVGALQLFDKPAGAGPDYVRKVAARMRDVPDIAPLFLRRPYRSVRTAVQFAWQEDPRFDIEHHVRHSALIRPGRYRELFDLCSRLHSSPLARDRPLWEAHVIEGLAGNKFAVYIKMHHALIDGVRGMRLMEASLSDDPNDHDVMPMWAATSGSQSMAGAPLPRDVGADLAAPNATWGAVRSITSDAIGMPGALTKTLVGGARNETSSLSWGAPRTILNQTNRTAPCHLHCGRGVAERRRPGYVQRCAADVHARGRRPSAAVDGGDGSSWPQDEGWRTPDRRR